MLVPWGSVDRERSGVSGTVAAAAAALAAGGIATSMLVVGTGGVAPVVTVALVAAQVVLLLVVRRGAIAPRRFLLAWSAQAGLTYLVAGDPTVASALVYLGVGAVFAVVVLVGLAVTRASVDTTAGERGGDTRPLPVSGGE